MPADVEVRSRPRDHGMVAPADGAPTVRRSRSFWGFAASQLLFWTGCLIASISATDSSTFWVFTALSAGAVILFLRGERRVGGLMALAVSVGLVAAPNNAAIDVQFAVSLVVSGLLLLALLFSLGFQKARPTPVVLLSSAVIMFILQYFSSVFASSANGGLVLARFALPALLILLVGVRLGRQGVDAFTDGLILLGVSQSCIAILEVVHVTQPPYGYSMVGETLLMHPINSDLVRAQAMLGHPIILGILTLVSILLLARRGRSTSRVELIVGILILAAGLYLSGARSAWLIGLVCFAVVLISKGTGVMFRMYAAIATMAVVVYLFLDQVASVYLAYLWDHFSESGSYTHRNDAFSYGIQLATQRSIGESLFGSGVSSEKKLFAMGFLQQDGLQVIDNQFLTTLATTGVAGLAVLLVFCVIAIVKLRGGVRLAFISLCGMFVVLDELRWLGPMMLFFALASFVDLTKRSVAVGTAPAETEAAAGGGVPDPAIITQAGSTP